MVRSTEPGVAVAGAGGRTGGLIANHLAQQGVKVLRVARRWPGLAGLAGDTGDVAIEGTVVAGWTGASTWPPDPTTGT
jgi:NADP-dependent 3-hydroxy acid dehydrogenase YdfG